MDLHIPCFSNPHQLESQKEIKKKKKDEWWYWLQATALDGTNENYPS